MGRGTKVGAPKPSIILRLDVSHDIVKLCENACHLKEVERTEVHNLADVQSLIVEGCLPVSLVFFPDLAGVPVPLLFDDTDSGFHLESFV